MVIFDMAFSGVGGEEGAQSSKPGWQTNRHHTTPIQWHNRWGAECPPETSDREISADLLGKERQGKKGKWSRKEGKSRKGIRRKNDFFFLFFSFFFFFFFFACHFSKRLICFGSTKMGIFYWEKAFHAGKKNQEKLISPLRKIFLLCPLPQFWPYLLLPSTRNWPPLKYQEHPPSQSGPGQVEAWGEGKMHL